MTSIPTRPGNSRWRGLPLSALPYAILVIVLAGGLATRFDPTSWGRFTGPAFTVVQVIGIVFSIRVIRCRTLARADRRPWWLVLAYFVCSDLAGIPMTMAFGQPGSIGRVSPALVVGIALGLLSVPLLLALLLSFISEPLSRQARYRFAMDITVVLGGGFAVMWYTLLGPTLTGTNQFGSGTKVMAAAYGIADLILALGICTVLLRGTRPTVRRALPLLIAGAGSYLVFDPVMVYLAVHPNPNAQAATMALGVLVRTVFLASAAIEQQRGAAVAVSGTTPVVRRYRPQYWPPYLALLLGFGLLLVAAARSGWYPWSGLVAGCVTMVAGVAARQVFALRENQAMLVTDHLTGLANRIQLRAALDRAVDQHRRRGVPIAVLVIDLDGFKQVNDTYGHEAGDRLLMAFADVLRRCVRGGDIPARIGGDEFAVVLATITDAVDACGIAERILSASAKPVIIDGEPIAIRASIGIAVATRARPRTAAELVRLADAAMYTAKRQDGEHWYLDDAEATRQVERPRHLDDTGAGQPAPAGEKPLGDGGPFQDHSRLEFEIS